MSRPLVPALLLASLAASAPVLTSASAQSAAKISTDRGCYARGDQIKVSLSGMPAGELVDVRVDDDVAAPDLPIDAAGNAATSVTAPDGRPPRPIPVRAQVSLQVLAATTVRLSVPVVTMSPTSAKPTTRVSYAISGFAGTGPIYAHVARGPKHVRTVRVGTPPAPCAELVAKIPQLPLSRPPKGLYTVQFDQQRAYRAGRAGSVRRSVRVRFAPRRASAGS
jgi:hypothetical protein